MSIEQPSDHVDLFWRRQFATTPTIAQIVFDIAFGIVLPVICVLADPIVFRSSRVGEAILGRYAVVGYSAIAVGVLSLALWLAIGRYPELFVGLLAGGAVFAVLLGVVILPTSIIGIGFLFIGSLGFSPFLTAFVFCRNALRAARQCKGQFRVSAPGAIAILGFCLACGGPWIAQKYVSRKVARGTALILSANPSDTENGVTILRRFSLLMDFDFLVRAYDAETDRDRRAQLAAAYESLTSQNIDKRLAILND